MNPELYTQYTGFIVQGCPWSTDIDILVFCPESAIDNGGVKKLYSSEIERLESELVDLSYNIDVGNGRGLDINQIVVENDKIVASTKGGAESGNIALATWHLHPQIMNKEKNLPQSLVYYPLKFVELNSEEFEAKVRSLAKFVWDYLKYALSKDEYQKIRDWRKGVYDEYRKNTSFLMTELPKIMKLIVTDPVKAEDLGIDMTHWRSFFKTVTMKLVQIIYFDLHNTMSYEKHQIAKDAGLIFSDYLSQNLNEEIIESGSLYYLGRGNHGGSFQSGLIPYLMEIYFTIVDRILDKSNQSSFTVDNDTLLDQTSYANGTFPGNLPEELISLFLESPKDATQEFENQWHKFINCETSDSCFKTVNQIFLQDLRPSIELLTSFSFQDQLPAVTLSTIDLQFIMIPQRTSKWLELLSDFYTCGNNGAEIGQDFQATFNLIRGSILEPMCTDLCPIFFDLEELRKIVSKSESVDLSVLDEVTHIYQLETGLIVDEIGKRGCKGAAPDLLLMLPRTNNENNTIIPLMIPIEIKGLKSGASALQPIRNSSYRRGLSLARRQISSVKEIINPSGFEIKFGLVVLTWIYEGNFGMEVHVEPL
jgi:hypothetical protein